MLNPTALLARAVRQNLADVYRETFGDRDQVFATGLDEAARLIIERKLNALYYEFMEIGRLEQLGYKTPADMIECYPSFFSNAVEPYLADALRYLDHTIEGKQWIANLSSHVLSVANHRQSMRPHL